MTIHQKENGVIKRVDHSVESSTVRRSKDTPFLDKIVPNAKMHSFYLYSSYVIKPAGK